MTTKEIRRDAERIRSRHRLRMRAFRKGALIFFPDGSGTNPVRLDGGPGSGFFGHAGIPGQVGGSSPAGSAPCAATAARTEALEKALSGQEPSSQASCLVRCGAVPLGEADSLQSGVSSTDEETREAALNRLDEYREKYLADRKQASEPKTLGSEIQDQVAALSDEEVRDWVTLEEKRQLTAEEETWANPYNDLQKVVVDMDLTQTPQVVCHEDFENYVEASGAAVIYRGVTDSAYMEMSAANIIYQLAYEDGKAYMGNGVFGNGIYFSTYRDTADFYSQDVEENVVRCAVRSDARILDFYSDEINTLQDRVQSEDSSIGAVCAGYDIVQVEDYYIVLNRAALIMEDPTEEIVTQIIGSAAEKSGN